MSDYEPQSDVLTHASDGEGPVDAEVRELEQRLAELSGEVATLDVVERNARLARAERDLCALQCEAARQAGGAREHPVLGVALGWEERLRRAGATLGADEVEHVGAEILIHGLRDRERGALDVLELSDDQVAGTVGAAGSDRLFHGLLAVEELRQRVEGRANALGIAGHADLRAVIEEAGRVQRVLRDGLARAAGAVPPDGATRRRWAGRLVDLADETVLGASEQEPRIAARQLSETARALEWHLERVEHKGTDQHRRLRRRLRRVESERVEQHLQARLERRFSKRWVDLWEKGILAALGLVMFVLFVDVIYGTSRWLLVLDTAVCGFFLVDFFVKASFVGFHPTWLRRHVLTDLVPALPYGWFIGLGEAAEAAGGAGRVGADDLGRSTRFLRLLRALKIIRLFRALSFLVRGLDRIVRQNARLLEGEVLLFPTPDERKRRRGDTSTPEARLWRLRGNLDSVFEQLYESADEAERERVAELRTSALRDASRAVVPIVDTHTQATVRRLGLPVAEKWLGRLSVIRSEEIEGRVGTDAVEKIARGARLVARSPLRMLPLLGGWAPPDAAELPDRRVASRTVRAVSRSAGRFHRRVLWWADLKGTLTPGEVVGRVGAALVARTARPAVRLLMFGALYGLLKLIMAISGADSDGATDVGFIEKTLDFAGKVVQGALLFLGTFCLVVLAFGVWLQRLAQDATTFHERVARAQFLHLTDSIKARQRQADAALLAERVFRLERNLRDVHGAREGAERDGSRFVRHLERFLSEGVSPPSMDDGFDPVSRAVMLHRDLLDGALLAESDTRATSQLLGNLALQRLVGQSKRISKATRKRILRIDLERRRTFVRGPYLWFHSIGRALSSRSARLIVNYNGHAIPLSELDLADPLERARYDHWLAGHEGMDEASARLTHGDDDEPKMASEAPEITTAFTVLHFLDDSPARDAEVAARFGDRVLERLREDRRILVRTVFGTYPLHKLPRESRILNVRALYSDWIEGGRVLFLPLRASGIVLSLSFRGLKSLGRAVAAIRRPELFLVGDREVEADFHAASRKIGRMRGPGAQVGLYLRAVLDLEYHGLALPFGLHDAEESDVEAESACRRDAAFLDVDPETLDVLAALESRAKRNVGRLERAAKDGLLERLSATLGVDLSQDPAGLRALTLLIQADDRGIRSRLFGPDLLCETAVDMLEFGLPPGRFFPPIPLWLSFRAWWFREGGKSLVVEAVRSSGVLSVEVEPDDEGVEARKLTDKERRKLHVRHEKHTVARIKTALWRALQSDVDGAREALLAARARHAHPGGQEAYQAEAEEALAALLRHPARITEQLVTLRTIQTLTLIDVRNYRRHVWSLGEYRQDMDPGEALLEV